MLTDMAQVFAAWSNRYQLTGNSAFLVEKPGFSHKQIEQLETQLGVRFHSSWRQLLVDVKLNSTHFMNLHFGFGKQHGQLDFLMQMNKHILVVPSLTQAPLIAIGAADGYSILLRNDNGEIYIQSSSNPSVASLTCTSLDAFITVAANIATKTWDEPQIVVGDDWKEPPTHPSLGELLMFLRFNQVAGGHEFWRDLAFGWA